MVDSGRWSRLILAFVLVVVSQVAVTAVSQPAAARQAESEASIGTVTPARLWDSRDAPTFDNQQRNTGRLDAGTRYQVPVRGRGGVPGTASGAVVTLTAINPSTGGYATLFPCAGDPPNASTINYTTGVTIANTTTVALDADGGVCVFTFAEAHFALDVVGHVRDSPATDPETNGFDPTSPVASGCMAQRIENAVTLQPDIAPSQKASPIVETGWFYVWNLDGVATAKLRIGSNAGSHIGQMPGNRIAVFLRDSKRPGEALDARVELLDDGNNVVSSIPCTPTANGLDGIVDGATIPSGLQVFGLRGPVSCSHLGTAGPDLIVSGSRNDVICPMAGNDSVSAGAGDDQILAYDGRNIVDAEFGNDEINGHAGLLVVDAGVGDDIIYGSSLSDALYGGSGADRVYGRVGNDIVNGNDGNDRLFGGWGNDDIGGGDDDAGAIVAATDVDFESGDDTYDMGAGNDIVRGGLGTGNDTAYGGSGNDRLFGGVGQENVSGGPGNDILDAEPEPDGALADRSRKIDFLDGDSGNDLIRHVTPFETVAFLDNNAIIFGGDGNDLIITLDASFDSVHFGKRGTIDVGLGACTTTVDVLEPGQSGTVTCSLPIFDGVLDLSVNSDGNISLDPVGAVGYFFDTLDGTLAAIEAGTIGLDGLSQDACICDPTIKGPNGLPILQDLI